MNLLFQLKNDGMSAIWDQIKPELVRKTCQQLGTIFPQALIEEAKSFSLDIKSLGIFVLGVSQQ